MLRDIAWDTFALPLERGAPLPDGNGFDYEVLDVVYGDLDGDGAEEAAVNAVQTYGGNGGNSHILVYRAGNSAPELIGDITGGDRAMGGATALRIDGGRVVVDRAMGTDADPMCCASQTQTEHWLLRNGALVEDEAARTLQPTAP